MIEQDEFGLSHSSVQKMRSVFRKYPKIEKVIIYGSRAKGNYTERSDVDLTMIGPISLNELLSIESALDDLLLIHKIDLSIFSGIENASLVEHINRVGKIFYERDHRS